MNFNVIQKAQEEFLEAVQPIVKQIALIEGLATYTLVNGPDGDVEFKKHFTPAQQFAIEQGEKAIRELRNSICKKYCLPVEDWETTEKKWIENEQQLAYDMLIYGENFKDAITGERIDPANLVIKDGKIQVKP